MTRPEHLSCPNTAEGIRRINEMQEHYDNDPEEYERQEQQERENQQMEAEREYQEMLEANRDNF